jgi:hypothetical protein
MVRIKLLDPGFKQGGDKGCILLFAFDKMAGTCVINDNDRKTKKEYE